MRTRVLSGSRSLPCRVLLCLFLFGAPGAFAASPEPPGSPPDYVVDLCATIDPQTEPRISAYLKALEEKTSAQVAVLTVCSLEGESIDAFSLRVAEKWKLGQKGKDNGLLLVISRGDRKYRFEVGYGLESILPDSVVGSIGREYLVPRFRREEYSDGVLEAVFAIGRTIAQSEGVQIDETPAPPASAASNGGDEGDTLRYLPLFLVAIALFPLLIFFATHPKYLLAFLMASGRGRSDGGWSGGGGFGGGGGDSGGGFGGGGGGFGGGGASGEW